MSIEVKQFHENWGSGEGYACIFVSDREFWFFHWPTQAAEMVAHANAINGGKSVYVSWSLFSEPRRKGDLARLVPGILLDLDLKSGCHAADNLPASPEEALKVLGTAGLPRPTRILHSGGGLYVHYLFEEPLQVENERDLQKARVLLGGVTRRAISAFRAAGMHLDNVSDLSRVIRPIGSANWKYGSDTTVRVIEDSGCRYKTADFEALVGTGQLRTGASQKPVIVNVDDEGETRGCFARIEENCAFVRHLNEDAVVVTEPEWYAGATIAAHCEDGEERFHALSARDEARYSEDETASKLRHGRRARPRRCQSIEEDLGFDGCGRCPFKAASIRSPYSLAFGDPELLKLQRGYVLSTDTDIYLSCVRDEPPMQEKSFNNQFGHILERPHHEFVASKRSPKVRRVDYVPGDERLILEPDDGVKALNTWRKGGVTAAEGDSDILLEHFLLLFPELEHRNWVLDYLAHLMQQPRIKIAHAIMLISEPGLGKSVLNLLLQAMFGRENVFIDDAQIHATPYRMQLGNRQVLVVEEMATSSRWEVSNELKPWLTSDLVQASDKYIRSHLVRSPRGVFIWTNQVIPVVLDKGERRHAVFRVDVPPQQRAYYDRLFGPGLKQAAAFVAMLMSRDISHWSPHARPMMTTAKSDIIDASRTPAATEIRDLIESGTLRKDLLTVDEIMAILNGPIPPARFTKTQVQKALHELKCSRLEKTKLSDAKTLNLWALRNVERWRAATHAERKAYYEASNRAGLAVISRVVANAELTPAVLHRSVGGRELLN